jgi:hypothetical protein
MKDYRKKDRKQGVNSRKQKLKNVEISAASVSSSGCGGGSFDAADFFETEWKAYPRKTGKDEARRHFLKSVTCEADLEQFRDALSRYLLGLSHETWRRPQDGKKFFGNWRSVLSDEIPLPAPASKGATSQPPQPTYQRGLGEDAKTLLGGVR